MDVFKDMFLGLQIFYKFIDNFFKPLRFASHLYKFETVTIFCTMVNK